MAETRYSDDPKTKYPITMSVRITKEMRADLIKMAAYEETRLGTFCRQELLKVVRKYERNPQYKRWLKRMENVF